MRKLPIDLKMEFHFRDRRVAVDLGADLAINEGDLTAAMLENPPLSAFYASVRGYAKRRARDLARREKAVYAGLFLKHRGALLAAPMNGERRASDKLVEQHVLVDPEYQAAQREASQAEYEADMADAAREAFRDRREMLVGLSADKRMEREIGVSDAKETLERAIKRGRA